MAILIVKLYCCDEDLKAVKTIPFFFLWSFIKDRVFLSPLPEALLELRYRTEDTITSIIPALLTKV